jgi:hypothetical protein
MEIAIAWVLLSIVNAILGNKREIGGFEAFIVSVLFSPLVGFIFIAFSKDKVERQFQVEMLQLLRTIAENSSDVPPIVEPEKMPINDDDI